MQTKFTNIEVTADDIRRGTQHSCRNCPIAIAVSRAVLGYHIHVNTKVRFLLDPDHALSQAVLESKLPVNATDFIDGFDHSGDGKPFYFQLEVPAEPFPYENPISLTLPR